MTDRLVLTLDELPDRAAIDRAQHALQDRLAEDGSQLATADWGVFGDQITTALRDKLAEFDLLMWLGRAWATARELKRLAQDSLNTPGEPQALPLAQHDLSGEVHPVVTMKCGEMPLKELRFTLALEANVAAAVLIVIDGKLTALEAATFELTVSLLFGELRICGPVKKGHSLTKPYLLTDGGIVIARPPDPPILPPV